MQRVGQVYCDWQVFWICDAFCGALRGFYWWLQPKKMHSPQYWSILCLHNRPGRDSVCCQGSHRLQRVSWGRKIARGHRHTLEWKQNKILTWHVMCSKTISATEKGFRMLKNFCFGQKTEHTLNVKKIQRSVGNQKQWFSGSKGNGWSITFTLHLCVFMHKEASDLEETKHFTWIHPTCIIQPATATCTRPFCH